MLCVILLVEMAPSFVKLNDLKVAELETRLKEYKLDT